MMLDVFKEGQEKLKITNKNDDDFNEENNDSEIQKIKSHLNVTYLKYVSNNIRHLLKLDIVNDKTCFEEKEKHLKPIRQVDKYRVILYIRLSVEDGDVIDGDVSKSIRNQLLILLDECEKKDWVVVAIFCEEGISGADDNRPEWNKSLKFCEYGNTEIVLCKSQSRFSRSMEMIEKYLHNEFINWNIRFVGLVDSTDTSIVGNKKTRQINGLVNEWQVEDQSINIRAVLKNKQSNGLFTGAFAPYGYLKDSKDKYHLIIDEEAAKVIRKIFTMYANGEGATNICKYLNENKVPIPSIYKHQKGSKFHCRAMTEYDKKIWRTNTIYNMLKNEVYIGTLIQHKNETISYKNKKEISVPKEQRIVVPHCHEAIIDMDTWNTVNSRFGKNKKTRSGKSGEIPLFSGKIKCDCCGHSFYRDSKTEGKKNYNYWICGNRYTTAKFLCNNNKVINEKDIYQLVIEEINKQLEIYYNKELVEKNYYEQAILHSLENEINILKKEKDDIEKIILKKKNTITVLYEDRANGDITIEEFSMIKNKNCNDIKSYKERLNHIEEELSKLNERKNERFDIEKLLNRYKKIEKLPRNILDEFVFQIHIGCYNSETKTRRVKIEWNIG